MTIADQSIIRITFALKLSDDYSKQGFLEGTTEVFLKESKLKPIENEDKYYVYVNQPGTLFTVRVENKYYFDKEVNINIAALDRRNPVVPVVVKPNYVYPYPSGATLIRGKIVDTAGKAIEGASASILNSATVNNQSDTDGKFILYLGSLTEETSALESGIRYVFIAGSTSIKMRITHPNYYAKTVTLGKIAEGGTKLLTAPVTLIPR
jgi:hypothetical protein